MNKFKISILSLIGLMAISSIAYAAPNAGQPIPALGKHKRLAEGCTPATASADLDINNVRAHILNGGDMWWDLVGLAKYEVPKVTQEGQPHLTSLFAGSIWIGGYDHGNLKEAAMTYRQNGSDFFPGPLDVNNAGTDAAACLQYDKIWKINKSDIDNFHNGTAPATADMISWPAAPLANTGGWTFALSLAPFKDMDGDGHYTFNQYDAKNSDYPTFFAVTSSNSNCEFMPDQNLWWVYNDNGNTHNETHALAIGLEVQAHAFAFVTNDQLNSATFYSYKIINRGTYTLDSTFLGQWVDPDLGYAFDDYVAVDTNRSLGICYNGENIDPGALGYGKLLPAVGTDFFLGPKADDSTGIHGKYLPMTSFVYYNNDFNPVNGNPEQADDYYFFMTARWKQGSYIRDDGKNGTGGGPKTKFMFPGDPRSNNPNDWTEKNAGNPPGDRRFLQASGPFTLKPGAVNNVTVGAVWARSARESDNTDAITELLFADDLAQTLYDDCFQLRIGPEPPVVQITELANKVVISFIDQNGSINKTEKNVLTFGKSDTFRFEGYLIYQLANSSVSAGELSDISQARLVAQSDMKSSTIPIKIINNAFDPILGTVSVLEADRADSGVQHTYEITKDLFAASSDKLINNSFYYYMVMAYGYNAHPSDKNTFFLSGRPAEIGGVPQLVAVPHSSSPLFGGASLNSDYGTQVPVRRIEGTGNGGNSIDLDPSSIAELFANNTSTIDQPLYLKGAGPVSINVYDPLLVTGGDFKLKIYDSTGIKQVDSANLVTNLYEPNPARARWVITQYNNNSKLDDTVALSQDSISIYHDQVVSKLGLVVSISQPLSAKFDVVTSKDTADHYRIDPEKFYNEAPAPVLDSQNRFTNGFISATITFDDPANYWLTGIYDGEQTGTAASINPFNWIRSGTHKDAQSVGGAPVPMDPKYDDVEIAPDWTGHSVATDAGNTSEIIKSTKSVTTNIYTIVAKSTVYILHPQLATLTFYYGRSTGRTLDVTWDTTSTVGRTLIHVFDSNGTPKQDTLQNVRSNISAALLNAGDTLFIDSTYDLTLSQTATHRFSYDNWVDPRQIYEGLLAGVIAPGGLAARSTYFKDLGGAYEYTLGPIPNQVDFANQRINMTEGVDLVFTSDKSKWTKCIVFEEGETSNDPLLVNQNEGGAKKFDLRKHANPFVDGNNGPVYSPGANPEMGTSWFPGYAINVETGERLNIMFGEDSHDKLDNGNDMIWNPTNINWQYEYTNPLLGLDYINAFQWGGKHWIYVMSSRNTTTSSIKFTASFKDSYPRFAKEKGVAYDSCKTYLKMLTDPNFNYSTMLQYVFGDVMWVMPPALTATGKLKSVQDGIIPSDAKIRLRVVTPYATYPNATGTPENHQLPVYAFSTASVAPTVSVALGKQALAQVNVVPNPYYAYSQYETSQLDNRIRITNLPGKCTIDIFTIDGSLVRRYNVDQPINELRTTYLDWDLKNTAGIPVASGVYLIHINAGDLGEKVLKWFGVMRPIDLDTF